MLLVFLLSINVYKRPFTLTCAIGIIIIIVIHHHQNYLCCVLLYMCVFISLFFTRSLCNWSPGC
jgi:hypothetical protein